MSNHPILLVDAMNLFVRSYSAYPTMSSHGYQMGGAIGFIKTLLKIVNETQPKNIYIAWEGGGSSRRRSLFSEYKLNRNPQKMNRFYGDDIPDTENNRQYQILSLLKMLNHLPVCQLYANDCEGDDVIAYLCSNIFKSDNKIIASSDKDLYQLLDEKTRQYSLHKKTFITRESVFDEFKIAANNFAIAKAICGDRGDNVPGIKGIGWRKVVKLFPFLGLDEDVILQTIFDYSHTHKSESRLYQRIIDNTKEIKRNWKLVYLDGNMIANNQIKRIDHSINTFKPTLDRMKFMKCLHAEGIDNFNFELISYVFNCIENINNAE